MKTLVLGAISALTFSFSAAAEPLVGGDMALALGGKMLAGDDGKFYRFYANGLLEVTGDDDADLPMSFGKWEVGPKYLCLNFPGSDERHFYTLDATGAGLDNAGDEGFEGALDIIMEPIDGGSLNGGCPRQLQPTKPPNIQTNSFLIIYSLYNIGMRFFSC